MPIAAHMSDSSETANGTLRALLDEHYARVIAEQKDPGTWREKKTSLTKTEQPTQPAKKGPSKKSWMVR